MPRLLSLAGIGLVAGLLSAQFGVGGGVIVVPALVAFQRFWPNPDWGTPANPGCFCTFSLGDVDFFLLDARTFRSAPNAATSGNSTSPA